ncbi:hypothetical protein AB0G79_04005 [Streptomyces sp. NPDC020807]|uniref:hypothetical protein n=1 Tax=Streptomyces sp. NPDC020807 TaxID=3155119 RepID=UPI003403AEDF
MRTLTTAAVAAAGAVLALVSAGPVPAAPYRSDVRAAVGYEGTCHDADGGWACTVEMAVGESESGYEKAVMEGEVYVNCTRRTVQRSRSLQYATAGQADFAVRTASGAVRAPSGTARASSGAGRTPTSFTWTRYDYRDVAERIEPGEVSWVEVQRATQKGSASFVVRDENGREQTLTGTFEGPAAGMYDRLFQRTGPMTEEERGQCSSSRPE